MGCPITIDNTQKQKILIVDDSEINRSLLADMLGGEYEIIEAEDGAAAIAALQKYVLDISLVLLDVVMPHVDGFEVLTVMNQKHWIEDIPVIMISAESGSSQLKRAYELGVTDFITRPFDTLVVRTRVENTILLYTKQKKLIGMLADQIDEKERLSSMMVDILSHVVEFRNGESGLHIIHVRTLTDTLLRQLQRKTDRYSLTPSEISLICTASALHDIGKIAINEDILNKPGRLTAEEFEVMKTHSLVGAEMLKKLPAYEDEPLIKTAYEICRWHHERYDGRGYPDGLKGDEIPISAQIVALADVYDALTSDRCYKKAIPHDTAVRMILDGQCGAFNPLLLECLQDVAPSLEEELAGASTRAYRPELRRLSPADLAQKDLSVSERSLRLLDYERMKYNFFAAMTEEIQFEYTVTPSLLTLSGWGAKRLGLSEVIMDPQNSEDTQKLMGPGTWDKIAKTLEAATPEHPLISCDCPFRLNGQVRWHRIIAQAIWSADEPAVLTGTIGKCVDIHDSRAKMAELEKRASHDMLTGLLNHVTAREMIRARLADSASGNCVMVIFDLDRFKSANDNLGHMFGDQVLRYVAEKLSQATRRDDIVARVGGDEFLVFMNCGAEAELAVRRIFNTITGHYEGFPLSISMGAAHAGSVSREYDELFHAADQALYTVKRAGGSQYRFYDNSMRGMLSAISPIEHDGKGERRK